MMTWASDYSIKQTINLMNNKFHMLSLSLTDSFTTYWLFEIVSLIFLWAVSTHPMIMTILDFST